MRKNRRSDYTESNNAQAAVDSEGTQLIMGEHVSQSDTDNNQIQPSNRMYRRAVGKPDSASIDAGCVNVDMIEKV